MSNKECRCGGELNPTEGDICSPCRSSWTFAAGGQAEREAIVKYLRRLAEVNEADARKSRGLSNDATAQEALAFSRAQSGAALSIADGEHLRDAEDEQLITALGLMLSALPFDRHEQYGAAHAEKVARAILNELRKRGLLKEGA